MNQVYFACPKVVSIKVKDFNDPVEIQAWLSTHCEAYIGPMIVTGKNILIFYKTN